MSTEPLRVRQEQLERAVQRLADALAQPKDEFIRDAAIQRFEFTFELTWKVLKLFLEYQGIEARSPRACIRESFVVGLLPEDDGWLEMVTLRNLTSHTYDEATAERVYQALPQVVTRIRDLLERLTEELEKP
ncbi:MAG: nucleotidyltransferase substrate binding protein [Candidatus Competibacteraceae bacterium]|nr:nucleotidyltransferase substrate binding protein [Candidatus Competibacteraceae bacterium]